MDVFLWIGITFAAIVLAILVWQDIPLLATRQVRTDGTVIDHRRSVDDGSEYFAAKVRFKADDGRWIEIEDSVGYPRARPPVGTQVSVVYPAGAPQKGRVRRLWLRPLLYGIMLFMLTVLVVRLVGYLK
jgi:hypothetical protein